MAFLRDPIFFGLVTRNTATEDAVMDLRFFKQESHIHKRFSMQCGVRLLSPGLWLKSDGEAGDDLPAATTFDDYCTRYDLTDKFKARANFCGC